MSLNIGSNIISPIQINNVINNQSNKNVIPSKNQQIIGPDKIYKLCENLTGTNVNISGTAVSYTVTTDYLNIFPTQYAKINGMVSMNWTGVGTLYFTFDNAVLPKGSTYNGQGFPIYPNGTTIKTSGETNLWNNYDMYLYIYKYSNTGIRIGYMLDGQATNVTINLTNFTLELSDDSTFSSNYEGMNQVTVESIPSDYIIPEGTLSVLNSGTFDAKSYASVSVPGMATPTWTAASITNSTGKINYSINLPSGFKSTSQSFSSSVTLPSVIGTTITPNATSQIAVDAYRWTKGSIIVDTIPSTVGVYKKIVEKTITCSELNAFLSSQTTIPSFAFFSTPILNGTIEASTIIEIGSSTFHHCHNISSINFANVTSIGYGAFAYCYSLTNVSLPKLEYASSAFSYCSSLSTITLPKLKNLAGYNFYGCLNLVSAYFPEVTSINGYQNFGTCQKLITISLPKVTYIYRYQFQNCIALSTISFPLLETFSYPDDMFAYCKNLRSIYFMNSSVIFLSQSAIFNNCPITISSYLSGEYASIYVPSSLINDYKTHSIWSWFTDRFVGV